MCIEMWKKYRKQNAGNRVFCTKSRVWTTNANFFASVESQFPGGTTECAHLPLSYVISEVRGCWFAPRTHTLYGCRTNILLIIVSVGQNGYRFISNISTVLYFFNVPPPRAINGDVPLLETVPLLFQPPFRGMLPCQIHVWHTFQGFFRRYR